MENHGFRGLSRRDFLAAAIASGFALAVRPVTAGTVVLTDTAGIVADTVRIPAEGALLPAYLAHPEQGSAWPLVLVVHEIFGVHEHIRDVCRRLAKLGYLAIAPELFFRLGDVAGLQDINTIVASVVSKVPDAQVMQDLDAVQAWATGNGMAQPGRVGVTGFCWGGRITWLYAAHSSALQAGVAWYGRLEGATTPLQPVHPLALAAELKAPVLGLYGAADSGIPVESVERMRMALAARGNGSDIVLYPEAPHAFFADYRPSYRKEAAEDGWRRMQSWFAAHGVTPQ